MIVDSSNVAIFGGKPAKNSFLAAKRRLCDKVTGQNEELLFFLHQKQLTIVYHWLKYWFFCK